MTLKEFDTWITSFLNCSFFSKSDSAINGVQVGNLKQEISSVAFALDCCEETIRRAIEQKANLLFVHHGLFWGKEKPITGNLYRRIQAMVEGSLSLYAVHLPLDASPEVGNNIEISKKMGLSNLQPFGLYKGVKIGFQGELPQPSTIERIIGKLGLQPDDCLHVIDSGKSDIRTVAVVSGGAVREAEEAADLGVDLFITGDASHEIVHFCRESGLSMISAGHYNTEMFGIRAMAQYLKNNSTLDTFVIDLPTGL